MKRLFISFTVLVILTVLAFAFFNSRSLFRTMFFDGKGRKVGTVVGSPTFNGIF